MKRKAAIVAGVISTGMLAGGVFAIQAISDLTDRMDQAPMRMEMPEPTPTTEMPDVEPTPTTPEIPAVLTETITIPARTTTVTETETSTVTETETITETLTPTSEKVVEQEADGNKDEGETSGTNVPPVIDAPADGEG